MANQIFLSEALGADTSLIASHHVCKGARGFLAFGQRYADSLAMFLSQIEACAPRTYSQREISGYNPQSRAMSWWRQRMPAYSLQSAARRGQRLGQAQ
jgi:hypothetical protein